MGKSAVFENDLLKLIFNATPIANIADNAVTSPSTSGWLALHTADPGSAGNQSTSEISYLGYTRVAVARTSGGWTITGNSASPVADITFGTMTSGAGGTATFASVGISSVGTTKMYYSGTLTPNISITNGVTPIVKAGSTIVET